MSFTHSDLTNALRDCFDTSLQCNIVDLGEVSSAMLELDADAPGSSVASRYRVEVKLILPVRDEAAEAQIIAQIANRLAGIWEISEVKIEVENVIWTPDRITPEGRHILGLDRPPRGPELVQIKLP
ncbi:MAG: DUF59 domain-containing protein [Acidobacteria bacterium]|nr:DUF59 domain-containing protein [Acidobacteriota bacterium]